MIKKLINIFILINLLIFLKNISKIKIYFNNILKNQKKNKNNKYIKFRIKIINQIYYIKFRIKIINQIYLE